MYTSPEGPDSATAQSPVLPPANPRFRLRRTVAVTVFGVALGAWIVLVGLPTDPVVLFLWLWLVTIAWNIEAPAREHLGFVRDWWPALALLMGYMYSRGLADELGIPVHVTSAIRFDEWLFGGTLPTAALQKAWCGDPCRWSSRGEWYDTIFATTYYSHFVVGLTVAVVLWLRSRERWLPYMRRYIGLNFLGLVCYIVYPLAPPWWASREGYLDEPVLRITARGWDTIGLQSARLDLGPDMITGNPVAAMPSLHTAVATLVALYGITQIRHPARWLLLIYPALMSLTLVYTGEHYVLDVLAGYVAACVVMVAAAAWERWRDADRDPAPAHT